MTRTLHTPKSRGNKDEAFTRANDIHVAPSVYVYMHPNNLFVIRLMAKSDYLLSV